MTLATNTIAIEKNLSELNRKFVKATSETIRDLIQTK